MSVFGALLQLFFVVAVPVLSADVPRLTPAANRVPTPPPTIIEKIRPESLGVEVTAKGAIVADAASGQVLFEKQPRDVHAIASLTKLMTALIVLDSGIAFDQEVVITADDMRGGGVEYFVPGEVVRVGDLWHAALINSSNTATMALARATGVSDTDFVLKMQTHAAVLGMSSARFVEPTGLDEGNRASAEDVLRLARAAFAMDSIRQTVILPSYEFEPVARKNNKRRLLKSTDQLLGTFLDNAPYHIRGGKTGSLGDIVGYHLALAISYEGKQQVYVVVLASESPQARFNDAKALAVWAFDTYRWRSQPAP